jgi:hypothetical protein
MTDVQKARWLADKIVAYSDYSKEAAQVLLRLADEIEAQRKTLAEEREACAKVCEGDLSMVAWQCADAIRLRGEAARLKATPPPLLDGG